ncbi:hypothetical protein GCM10007989_21230 [Devosia pacifica]|uniref:Fe2+ transport protein n=1 Tax=Devosia pacifica TaxID=1335967 RepID=A0A918VTZ9_9HYPH|nr:iron transporter [Devosia pacifica]GHA25314.1 hypothetical protein GCM10007989_21230 [Devosia pacifica]
MSDDNVQQVPSDEADKRQLELAEAEGEAYQRSLEYMVNEVAHTGAKKAVGDYIIGIAQEEAEGMYRPNASGELVWQAPGEENCHLEVAVCDGDDKRFVPGLSVKATLTSESGERIGPFEVPFIWHPGLLHYGTNVKIPGSGKYDVTVHIAPAPFARHDKTNGKRYGEAVEVVFEKVDIEAGQE